MQIIFGNDLKIRAYLPEETSTVSAASTPIGGQTSSTEATVKEVVVETVTTEGTTSRYQLSVAVPPGQQLIRYENLSPELCSVSEDGLVEHIANGTAEIRVHTTSAIHRLSLQMLSSGILRKQLKSYLPDSLGEHIMAAVDATINGVAAGDATQLEFSTDTGVYPGQTVVRNSSRFLSAYDTSAISVRRAADGNSGFPAVLISPRHAIGAGHVMPGVGSRLTWMRNDGSYVSALITGKKHPAFDVAVVHLDTEITGITPLRMFPEDWQAIHFPSIGILGGVPPTLPGFTRTRHRRDNSGASVWYTAQISGNGSMAAAPAMLAKYTNPLGFKTICGGDSGSPLVVPVAGGLVYISSIYGGVPNCNSVGGSGAADYARYLTVSDDHTDYDQGGINGLMNTMATAAGDPAAGSYAVNTVDLSGFTSYA